MNVKGGQRAISQPLKEGMRFSEFSGKGNVPGEGISLSLKREEKGWNSRRRGKKKEEV